MSTLVPRFPVVKAVIRDDGTGELTINGTSRPISAETVAWLRGGVIARCAIIARPLNRPVRLTVDDIDGSYELAVHGDAYVQPLAADGTIDDVLIDATRAADDGRCWQCRRRQSLKNRFCTQCGVQYPHDVEAHRPRIGGAQNV